MPTNNLEGINLSIGLKIEDFKKGLNEIKRDIDLVGKEAQDFKKIFKATGDESALKDYQNSLENLRDRLLEAKQELVRLYNEARADGLETTDARMHELVLTIASLDKKLAQTEDTLDELNTTWDVTNMTMGEVEQSLADQERELEKLESEWKQGGKAVDDFDDSLDNASNGGLTGFKVMLAELGARLVEFALDEVRQAISAVVEINKEFESLTAGLKALYGSDLSNSEFQQITEEIRELGRTTIYSASEIAQGMESMAKAGYNAEDSMQAVTASLNLAQATGEDVSTVSSILVDGLHAFGLEAESAGNFASILATAANATNVDVADLGDSLKYAGAVAGQFGYEAKDVATAIAVMGQQGIKGSQAGTTLRTMLTRLATNTSGARDKLKELGISFYDANKNARPLNDIITELRNSLQGADDQTVATTLNVIAGQRALTGLSAIINTSQEDWDQYTSAINDSSEALQQMVDTRTDTLEGDLKKLSNSASDLALEIGKEAGGGLREFVQQFTKILQSPEMVSAMKVFGNISSDIMTALSPALLGLTETLALVVNAFGILWENLENLGVLETLGFVLDEVVQVLNYLLGLISDTWAYLTSKIAPVLSATGDGILEVWNDLSSFLAPILKTLIDFAITTIVPLLDDLSQVALPILTEVLNILFDVLGWIVDVLKDIWAYLEDIGVIEAFGWAFESIISILDSVVSSLISVYNWFTSIISAAKEFLGLNNEVNNQSSSWTPKNSSQKYESGGFGDLRSLGFASGGTSNITINVNNNGNMITASTVRSWASIINEELGRQI